MILLQCYRLSILCLQEQADAAGPDYPHLRGRVPFAWLVIHLSLLSGLAKALLFPPGLANFVSLLSGLQKALSPSGLSNALLSSSQLATPRCLHITYVYFSSGMAIVFLFRFITTIHLDQQSKLNIRSTPFFQSRFYILLYSRLLKIFWKLPCWIWTQQMSANLQRHNKPDVHSRPRIPQLGN